MFYQIEGNKKTNQNGIERVIHNKLQNKESEEKCIVDHFTS